MEQSLFGFILYQCDPRTFTTIMTDSVYFLLTKDEAFRKYEIGKRSVYSNQTSLSIYNS